MGRLCRPRRIPLPSYEPLPEMGSPTEGSDGNGGRAPRQSLAPLYGHIQKYIGGKVRTMS